MKSVLLIAALLAAGCSHESARARRIASQADARMAAPAKARPEAECRRWDTIHVYGDWSAGLFSAVGTGAGIVAASTPKGDARDVAIWTGVGAAAAAAVSLGIAEQSAKTWTETCSQ